MSMLKVVVFPAPFTPSSPKHSPSGMPSHSPSTALTGGLKLPWLYCFSRPFSRTCHCCCLVPASVNSLSEGLSVLPVILPIGSAYLFCLPLCLSVLPILCLSVLPICLAYPVYLSVPAVLQNILRTQQPMRQHGQANPEAKLKIGQNCQKVVNSHCRCCSWHDKSNSLLRWAIVLPKKK